ncbi:MAG TPA: glycosyltransferase family A protein [Ferruginibacter sp.]|nr:hypothetical protein [Chitinophagaceae bacterium]HML57705.1 glycosyltransferase family A protein [Ferruginibacter sp.]HRN91881.1 glycosyltransferase family A protein [Ferruginibacter sp.]HRO05596.1 glycosyltransferase family A protein [Ferruginibacter sp.]HRO97197.1 glycosyltransferase family A protein [Ferruginibacter sp.]
MTDLDQATVKPWVSFCISTYKRPDMLREQIKVILQQTFKDFEIVISDNDPESDLSVMIEEFNDKRIRYSVNEENLGMVKSFNRSLQRARGEFVVMITDDDPVEQDFLSEMHRLFLLYPSYSVYAGFLRTGRKCKEVEIINKANVFEEILNMNKTPSILWSSCIMKKEVVLSLGGMPDYGSPHLADHALIVMAGSESGVVVCNKMFSYIVKHNVNFSKFNFKMYVVGCEQFYILMSDFIKKNNMQQDALVAVKKHLSSWFIVSYFDLKRFYFKKRDANMLTELESFKNEIFLFPFMQHVKGKYYLKNLIFTFKKYLLKPVINA